MLSAIEELLGRKSSGSSLDSREYGHRDPWRWPRGTLYPQKLALTSPTSGSSIGIVRSRTLVVEFVTDKKQKESGAIPVTGHEVLRIPHCLDNRLTDGGKVAIGTHRPHSTPHKHFQLLALISVIGWVTPGRNAAGRIRKTANKKIFSSPGLDPATFRLVV
jgi:hypothetical protein